MNVFTPLRLFSASLMVFGASMSLTPVMAQERSVASGATDMQATWAALHSLVASANTKAATVDARIKKIIACSLLNPPKFYAPGGGKTGAPADALGCIENLDISGLEAAVTAVNLQITDLNGTISSLNSTMNDKNNTLYSIEGNISSMNSQINSLKGTATDLTAKQADIANKISSLNSQLGTLTSQLDSLRSTLNTHTNQIADLYSKLAPINTALGNVNTSIANLNNHASSVNSSLSGLNNYMANILSCAGSGYIYNYNVGCVIPTGHASCYLYQTRTTQVFNDCSTKVMAPISSVYSCWGNHRDTCGYITTYACYDVACN